MPSISRGDPAHPADPPVRRFLRWSCGRSALWRGYWLLASVYLVVDAGLSASQLVLIGTAQSAVVFVAEVPAGIVSDLRSRRVSLVIAHVATGTGMVATGFVTSFPLLAATQALCGLGWAFASGADVAWITDELDDPVGVPRVLAARARWDLVGAAAGIVGFGASAAISELRIGIITSGLTMIALATVVVRFPERPTRFAAEHGRSRRASYDTLRRAVRAAALDREVRTVAIAWMLVNGSADAYGRLVETRLIELGFSDSDRPILWFTALGLALLGISTVVVHVLERRMDDERMARRTIVAASLVGVVGLIAFASATDVRVALAGVVLTTGCARPGTVVRTMTEIWVNRRTASDVRATTHSLLSLAEQTGEVALGATLAALASRSSTWAFAGSAALLLLAAALVWSTARGPRPSGGG
ncbi:MAG: MFS transporter [Actinomycetota bacterium]